MPHKDIPHSLPFVITFNQIMSIFKKRGPGITWLKNLNNSYDPSKMSFIWSIMIGRQDRSCLWLINTPLKQLVNTSLVNKWLIPKVMFGHMEEHFSLLRVEIRWDVSADQVVHNISIPWCHAKSNQQKLLIRETFLN